VIGINSQIYSRTAATWIVVRGPIDVAMKVKTDLQKYGKVSRGRLGVTIQGVSQELADSFGLKKAQGALVSAVEAKSPADKAGGQERRHHPRGGRTRHREFDRPAARYRRDASGYDREPQGVAPGEQELRASLGESPAEKVARATANRRPSRASSAWRCVR